MKKAWLFWWIVTAGMAVYVLAGFVASYTNRVDIKLEPGARVEVTTLRLAEHRLRMALHFQGDHQRRPELGDSARGDPFRTRLLEYPQPGSAIRIVASSPEAVPVVYEAMPKGGWGANIVIRNLTSNLSIRPGVWRWPDPADTPHVVLRPGLTKVMLEVASVEAPLIGELVQLGIHPALGFKECMPDVCWLWWWFAWPAGILVLALWAIGILLANRVKARREAASHQFASDGGS
jgi:hypothetical protein